MKLHLSFIAIILSALPALSQSWEAVKSAPDVIYGEGSGSTLNEADKAALADLLSKISISVSNAFESSEQETATKSGIDSKSTINSLVATYSAGTLANTEKVIIKNEPNARVGRWIKRSEVQKIFDGRKNKISDYITDGIRAEAQGKVDIALKDFYWALALVKTLQYPNNYNYSDDEDNSFLAISWLPRKINEILDNVNVKATKRTNDDVELLFTYKGKKVNSMDYAFFDGRDWSNIYTAKDGIGILELSPGYSSQNYKLRVEFEYRGEAQMDREIQSVLDAIGSNAIPKAYKDVAAIDAKAQSATTVSQTKATGSALADTYSQMDAESYAPPTPLQATQTYTKAMARVAEAITRKSAATPSNLFTHAGKCLYDTLIHYGSAKIVGEPKYTFYQDGDHVIARGLHMSFNFKHGARRSYVEEIIFYFNADGLIDNITFGLGKTAETDILCKKEWPENVRFAIMQFLENYKTAYSLRRLSYISTIFDDDAVIITANVPQKAATHRNSNEGISIGGQDIIKFNRYNKDEYLRELKRSFNSKEYVNIQFSDNEVLKLGKGGEVYGIQIAQEYYSSNYGDRGYLFLLVDMNDAEHPLIKVRTWQPERDPNFGLYGPYDFK